MMMMMMTMLSLMMIQINTIYSASLGRRSGPLLLWNCMRASSALSPSLPASTNRAQADWCCRALPTTNRTKALANRCLNTKHPSYVILLELTEQMSRRKITMDLRWQPRNENQHADDLTNEAFGNFCSTLRIATPLAELPWIILPRLVEAAAQLHKELADS